MIVGRKDAPFVFEREGLLIAVNPKGTAREVQIPDDAGITSQGPEKTVFSIGSCSLDNGRLSMPPQSFAIFER